MTETEIEVELGFPKDTFFATISTLGEILEEGCAVKLNEDLAATIRAVLSYYRRNDQDDLTIQSYGYGGTKFSCEINADAIFVFELSSSKDGSGKLLSLRVTPWNIEFTPQSMAD
jgi:hypothetical protein